MASRIKRWLPVRAINRLTIILKDFYIDFLIQQRFIGDRRIKNISQDKDIHDWQNTSYHAINNIFFKHKYVIIKDTDVIADVGCGDGKLFNYFIYKGLKNEMLGYEINQIEGAVTKKRLKRYPNVNIICEDIFNHFPHDVTLFYLFNPFSEDIMKKFITKLIKLKNNRPVIIYNNPVFVHLFTPGIFEVTLIPMHQYKHGEGKIAVINFCY